MTAPMFRFLTKEELAKLSHEERIEYTGQLIEHSHRLTSDIDQSIKARQERFKKSE